jgi:hypothetical protein
MKRQTILLALVLLLCAIHLHAQDEPVAEPKGDYEYEERGPYANLGVGIGLDYGGVGARLSVLPLRAVALFGAVGYNFNGAGFNGGVSFQLLPKKRVTPTLKVMYGYNAVIVVKGADQYNKTYNGLTFGGGIQLKSRNGNNFFSAALLIPIRSQEFHYDMNALQNNSSITGLTDLPPIAISIGYHFKI